MKNTYSEKSHIFVFDCKGSLTYSSNSLFNAGYIAGKNVYHQYPFLNCIKKDLEKLNCNGEPLFLPHIAFASGKYKSICDFIFTKTKKSDTEEITWMIYDNSIHYQPVILKSETSERKAFAQHYNLSHKSYRANFIR